jgi:hypothetical protein
MRAVLSGVIAATLSIQGAVAEEIRLRCDSRSSRSVEPITLSIDTDRNTVQRGTEDHGWWYSNRIYEKKYSYDDCRYNITSSVSISDNEIKFAIRSSPNIYACGGSSYHFMAGEHYETVASYLHDFSINRITGILTYSDVDTISSYQCQKFTGNAIP